MNKNATSLGFIMNTDRVENEKVAIHIGIK